MFATLVIGLPSPHGGGEVTVKHQGDKKILTLKHAFSYVSWYSDVIHEVLPVRSGYRWVLTYYLYLDPSRPYPTACLQTDEALYLYCILKVWLGRYERDLSERDLGDAYYTLYHKYTQANISLNAFKGRDLASVHLKEFARGDLPGFDSVVRKGVMRISCSNDRSYKKHSW